MGLGVRLLLVEDNVMIGEAVRDHLEAAGWSVEWVLDLDSAFPAFDRGPYAFVLLDLWLPDGNGLEFLSHLRGVDDDVPVIILSAQDQYSDRVKGMMLGASGYLVKPFNLSDLDRRLGLLDPANGARASRPRPPQRPGA